MYFYVLILVLFGLANADQFAAEVPSTAVAAPYYAGGKLIEHIFSGMTINLIYQLSKPNKISFTSTGDSTEVATVDLDTVMTTAPICSQ